MKKPTLIIMGFLLLNASSLLSQDAPFYIASTGIPVRVVSGDLDNDGDADLAWVTSNTNTLFTMLGDGSGGFNTRRSFAVPPSTLTSLALGDFNENGNLDVVVVNIGGANSVLIFYGNGDGTVGTTPQLLTGFNVGGNDVVVADFDPSPTPPFTSHLDIAVTVNNNTVNIIALYFGNGAGGFVGPSVASTGGTSSPRHLTAAVLPGCVSFVCPANLLVSNPSSGNVGVLISNGVGGFNAAVPIGGGLDRGVAWADFNGDGFLDIAAGRAGDGARVYLGTNSTGVAYNPTPLELTTPSVLHYRDICAGDFNGDGNTDLFGASDVVLGGSGLTTFFLNDGAGGFSAGQDDTLGVFINFTSCEAADINNNGLPDLLLGTVGSDSVAIYNLRAPTVTPASITSNPPAGANFTIPVTASDSTNIASVKFVYRQMGKTNYDTLNLTPGAGTATQRNYTGTLPASVMTNRGLEYFFRTSDGFITTNQPFDRFLRLSTSIAENAPATPDRSYQLVSFPMRFSPSTNGTPSIQIGDDFSLTDPNVARLFWWDPVLADTITTDTTSLKGYREFPFPGLTNFAFSPGRAMFLATNGSRVYDGVGLSTLPNITLRRPTMAGDSVPVDYFVPSFFIDSGWNMIATPFSYTVHMDSVDIVVPAVDTDIHELDSVRTNRIGLGSANFRERTATGYIAPSQPLLKPWRGYFLRNNIANQIILLFPKQDGNFPATAPSIPQGFAAGLDWKIDIAAKSGDWVTPPTTVGTSKNAQKGYDQLDWELPPALEGDLRVSFKRGKDFGVPGDYLTDIRPTLAESESWSFSVQPGTNRAIELNFDGLNEVPEDYDLILADVEGRTKQNLRIEPVYRFIASVERHFTLTITPKNPGSAAALMPTTYELYQNLPNPFNPQTLIKYDLPEAADVKLDVFNILGQYVATLVNAYQAAGPKSVLWDGTDAGGAKVASGFYFYKFTAGDFSAVKKMLFLK